MYLLFEDDFGWMALFEGCPGGVVRVVLSAPDGYVVWDKGFSDFDSAIACFNRTFPGFREVV